MKGWVGLKSDAAAGPNSGLMQPYEYNGTIHVWLDLTHAAEPDSYGCVRLETDPAFYELVPMRMGPMK